MTLSKVAQEAKRLGLTRQQVEEEALKGKAKLIDDIEAWLRGRLTPETVGWSCNIRRFLINQALVIRDKAAWEWAAKAIRQYSSAVGRQIEKPFGFLKACLANPWGEFPKEQDKGKGLNTEIQLSLSSVPESLGETVIHETREIMHGGGIQCADCFRTYDTTEEAQLCLCHNIVKTIDENRVAGVVRYPVRQNHY